MVKVGVIMGSQSDWETMRHASDTLTALDIPHETRIVSAHRTPDRMVDYARSAVGRGLEIIIAAAGGAAHLPGMTAAMTRLPVLGVPIQSAALSGMAQSIGYLLAATGPIVISVLHDATGAWAVPLLVMLGVVVVQVVFGILGSRDRLLTLLRG